MAGDGYRRGKMINRLIKVLGKSQASEGRREPIEWLKSHPNLRQVILGGGDPLLD